ncbi:flippase [Halosimplex halophilum]|uniref:flippase n=1 Tax=Halosimplex halophilum TaxID=2559572 RepID=UPI00107F879D|nr:flippase [Halosimplex halophilum]
MTSISRVVKGFQTELVAKGAAIVSGLIVMVLLARLLGPNKLGQLFYVLSILSIAHLLSNLGFPQSGARYVAEFLEENPSKVRLAIRVSLGYLLLSSLLVVLVLFLGSGVLESVLGESNIQKLLMVGAAYVFFRSLRYYIRRILQAFGAVPWASAMVVVTEVANLIFIFGLVSLGLGAIGAIAGYTLAYCLSFFLGAAVFYTQFYRSLPTDSSFDINLAGEILKYNFSLALTSGANAIEKETDTVLIGFFLGPSMVGFYALGKRIANRARAPAEALGFTLAPMYTEAKLSEGSTEAGHIYRQALVNILVLYVPAVVGLVLVARPVVKYIFGSEFLPAVPVIRLLALLTLFQSIGYITGNGLDYLGRAKDRAKIKGVSAVLNLILNLFLIPVWGIIGAAFATIVTNGIYNLTNVYFMHQETDFWRHGVIWACSKILLVTVVMAAPVYVLVPHIRGVFSLVLVIFIGIAIWIVGSFALSLITISDIRRVI